MADFPSYYLPVLIFSPILKGFDIGQKYQVMLDYLKRNLDFRFVAKREGPVVLISSVDLSQQRNNIKLFLLGQIIYIVECHTNKKFKKL